MKKVKSIIMKKVKSIIMKKNQFFLAFFAIVFSLLSCSDDNSESGTTFPEFVDGFHVFHINECNPAGAECGFKTLSIGDGPYEMIFNLYVDPEYAEKTEFSLVVGSENSNGVNLTLNGSELPLDDKRLFGKGNLTITDDQKFAFYQARVSFETDLEGVYPLNLRFGTSNNDAEYSYDYRITVE